MLKSKKLLIAISSILSISLLLSGCGAKSSTSSNVNVAPKEKIKLAFYANGGYGGLDAMCTALKETFKDKYIIDTIAVDWGNLDKVIRTGIAAGDPADVYLYWPQNMKPFVDQKMAVDLTPYLDANNGEWKKSFLPGNLETGNYGGKYYGVPIDSNYSVIYANSDILQKAGVTIPDKWSWADFMSTLKQIKKNAPDVTPFGMGVDNALGAWMIRNGILSLAKSDGKLDDLIAGKIDATTSPIFTTALKNIKDLYTVDNANLVYPGKGAAAVKRDEVKAAFDQGKIAMTASTSSSAVGNIKASSFKQTILPWPSMGKDSAVLGGCDGVFIPSNSKHIEAAVELLKAFTGDKLSKINADAGVPISNSNVTITDPIVKKVMDLSADVSSREFYNLSPKMTEYFDNSLVAELVLGNKSSTEILAKIEALRKETVK